MKNAVLYALIVLALWLLFVRRADGYCGACAAA